MLTKVIALVLVAVAAAVLVWAVSGGDGEAGDGEAASTATLAEPPTATEPAGEEPKPPRGLAARQVEAAVRAYVTAIDSRSGKRVCALLEPDALASVRLAHEGGSCPESLDASIGAAAPKGAPSWKSTRVEHFDAIVIGEGEARATLEVVHRFANRGQPSTEDDIVYLRREADGSWIVIQPSATLYRALGYPEPPLAAITPPE